MKIPFPLLPVAIILGMGQAPAAADDLAYSAAYKQCMSSGDAAEGITSGLLDCIDNERVVQDAKLNEAYQMVMAHLPTNRKDELRLSERGWIKSRDAICAKQAKASGDGTLSTVVEMDCRLQETVKRKVYLEQYR